VDRTTGDHAPPSPLPGSAAEPSFPHRHVGAVVDSPSAVVQALVPFVDEGLRAGDLVVLTTPADTAAGILDVLGERAGPVETDQRIALVGLRPPDAFGLTRKYLERAAAGGSGRLRIGAHVQRTDDPLEWREGERYEAAANVVLADAPLSALCVYDRSTLPPALLAGVERTHPLLLTDGVTGANAGYLDPRVFVRRLPLPREPVESGRPVFAVDDVPTLPGLRHALGAVLAEHVADEEQRGDMHLAVSEVAANAFRHGIRPVSARVWADATRMVCTITDRGHVFDDPIAGYVPAHGPDLSRGGMGLWLARKLWDVVDLVAGDHGFTVRLSTRLR
jgi:anti-sigma regulatory factor (Ser/Thr protein kinase)